MNRHWQREFRVEEIGSGFCVQELSRGEHVSEDRWITIGRWDAPNKCVVFSRDIAERIAAALSPAAE